MLVSYAHEIQVEASIIRVAYGSKLYVLNVEDPRNVSLEGTFLFDGDLVDSRRVGNVLYAVCSDYTLYENEGDAVVSTEAAYTSYGATWAVSINIADPHQIYQADAESFSGYGNLIQATNYALFVAANDYNGNSSLITYVDISDPEGQITVRGSAVAPGNMADRFKMDAWNGALRVVTNTWWPDRHTYITTFDITRPDVLTQLGQTALASASGESVYATRFDGPLAYVVTYLTVDPLFVVDLSDPSAPVVAGELKIPGWSTHIEPRGDRLIALGVDDQNGRRVMVSLFDVSNPAAPLRLDYVSFGEGWSWSSAYDDVKAFTVLEDMILVPFSGWNEASGGGYDRLQFLSYTRTDLDVKGSVDVQGSVVRSFEYGNRFYAVTQEHLAVIDGGNEAAPQVANTLALAENVTDILPLPNGWEVEVILRQDAGDTLLRAKDFASSTTAGEIAV
ncbi:MAG TPA: beta-propeller domain-containing protein, partial [Candidatus Hydrogenedentes bacterium]|nr:beta-propeller domain-containing protein [Candidatus Hydrogenedentota bacterium]